MKVEIGPYISRWTTTRLENRLMARLYGEEHWLDKYQDKRGAKVINFWGEIFQVVLNYTVNLVQDRRKPTVKVRIDPYDTWSMDHTLTPIILPMLKQLKETKHGSPYVDFEDLPSELQLNYTSSDETKQFDMFADDETEEIAWDMHEKRWDYILDSMIYSFEKLNEDGWENEFYSGEIDIDWIDLGLNWKQSVLGPNDTFEVDREGLRIVHERIAFGLRMFGKYFQALWD